MHVHMRSWLHCTVTVGPLPSTPSAVARILFDEEMRTPISRHSSVRSHCNPLVVTLCTFPLRGIRPQVGPSTCCMGLIWCRKPASKRQVLHSSLSRIMRSNVFFQRNRACRFAISWSNLPPCAPNMTILYLGRPWDDGDKDSSSLAPSMSWSFCSSLSLVT
jgi:hypothetical protein